MGSPYEEKLPVDWNCEAERKRFKEYLAQLNELFEKGEEIHPSNLNEYANKANTAHSLLYLMMRISRQYQIYIAKTKKMGE